MQSKETVQKRLESFNMCFGSSNWPNYLAWFGAQVSTSEWLTKVDISGDNLDPNLCGDVDAESMQS